MQLRINPEPCACQAGTHLLVVPLALWYLLWTLGWFWQIAFSFLPWLICFFWLLCMPGIVSFKLWGSRYFYISINILELCYGTVIWNSSIFSNLALEDGATAMFMCGIISHHRDRALLGPLTDALWTMNIFYPGWWEPEPFPALCDSEVRSPVIQLAYISS